MFREIYMMLNSNHNLGLGMEVEVLKGYFASNLSFKQRFERKFRLTFYKNHK